jgi:hypothetical protein
MSQIAKFIDELQALNARSVVDLRTHTIVWAFGTILFLVGIVLWKSQLRDPRLASLPPHVSGWPIINQTFLLKQDDPTTQLIAWAQQYGELFRTTSATTEFIWINSRRAFKELIDRKSSIYSSRHPMPMTSDVVSAGRRLLFMPYGNQWRAYRGIVHKVPYSQYRG